MAHNIRVSVTPKLQTVEENLHQLILNVPIVITFSYSKDSSLKLVSYITETSSPYKFVFRNVNRLDEYFEVDIPANVMDDVQSFVNFIYKPWLAYLNSLEVTDEYVAKFIEHVDLHFIFSQKDLDNAVEAWN